MQQQTVNYYILLLLLLFVIITLMFLQFVFLDVQNLISVECWLSVYGKIVSESQVTLRNIESKKARFFWVYDIEDSLIY